MVSDGRKRVLSGMRPTGSLHLGHLKGALENWVRLQAEYETFYMVADWHALTTEYASASSIRRDATEMVKDWIACGIDPEKSVLFVQSDVREHAELFLLFSMFVPLGWLFRCPTYKEQLHETKERDLKTYGFLGYPVLQAADILVYRAEAVPVGEDQVSHLELTREIARRFNHLYKNVFPEPRALLTKTPKLLGLDGRKMSKSWNNAISLSDAEETVIKKVQQMITDPLKIRRADPGHPEVCTVFSYYRIFISEKELSGLAEACGSAALGCVECKRRMAGIIEEIIGPIRKRRSELSDDAVKDILARGKKKAAESAAKTMEEVKKSVWNL